MKYIEKLSKKRVKLLKNFHKRFYRTYEGLMGHILLLLGGEGKSSGIFKAFQMNF